MGSKRGVEIIMLVEDRALERFSREVLIKFGFNRKKFRVITYPVGKGSNKNWVAKKYPGEVKALRRKGSPNIGMVIGTDADEKSVDQRANSLAKALKSDEIPARAANERIVLWIPKWHIETWLLHFSGEKCDEDTKYKKKLKKPDYQATAQRFVDEYRKTKSGDAIDTQPSLKRAYEETKRLGV